VPIAARWRPLASLPAPRGRDAIPGVYEIADANKHTIYIGQSTRDVPNRIRQHLARQSCIAEHGAYWRYAHSRVPRAHEADLIARYGDKHGGRLPACNAATPRKRSAQGRYLERIRSDD